MTPTNHGSDLTNPPQNHTLNPLLNPTHNSTFVENPNGYYQETHNHHQTITTNVVNHHVTNNVASNNSTFVLNPNEYDQETHNHHQTITNNVANHVSNNVACHNDNVSDNMGLTKEEWPFEYPPGYRFCPEDEELIEYYLRRRIKDFKLPHSKIKDVDLYRTTPDKVTGEHEPVGDNEWYFFTPRDRKYRNGKRPNRAAAGTGYWKATGADKPINFKGEVVGFRKALVFYHGKAPKGVKTNWIMHEYKVNETTERQRLDEHDMRLDDWVLCRIYNKNDKGSRSCKTDIDNEPKSETDEHIPNSPNNIETHAQPEMVVEDKKPPHFNIPNMDFIEDHHYYDKFFADNDKELFFSNSIKNTLDSMFNYLPPNNDIQANDLRHGLFCPSPLIDNKIMNSWQESILLPVEQINNVSILQNNLNCLPPNINASRSNVHAPSQRADNVEHVALGDNAPDGSPSKKQKHV
ncbi:DNA-binding transcription factor [Lithospermum erythrorhizon]|uniref:DNA-binding transcription factor n=1 Tax=Lithospermum erythrorhizon TaxID=34254 RepID=A0AAV3QIA2_LITER